MDFLHDAAQAISNAEIFYLKEDRTVAAFSPLWKERFIDKVKLTENVIGVDIRSFLPSEEVISKFNDRVNFTSEKHEKCVLNVPLGNSIFIWSISHWSYKADGTSFSGFCVTQCERKCDRSIQGAEIEQTTIDFILESVYDGYWDWYVQENYEYMSPRFWEMFGYDPAEMKMDPKEWMDIIFKEDLDEALRQLDAHIKSRGKEPYYLEARYRHKDGHIVYVICKGKVISWNPDGTPSRMIGTHTDVTELRNIQKTNIKLLLDKDKAEEVSQMKSRLLATLSHEIRTPLHGMMGMASLLEGSLPSNSSEKSQAVALLECCEALLRVLNDVLEMCRLDSFVSEMITQETKLSEFLERIRCLFDLKAKQKTTLLTTSIENKIGDKCFDIIFCDKNRIQQILCNLVNNAIKFTNEGKIVISFWLSDVEKCENGEECATAHFSVSDSGIGISDENLALIFEPFTQVENEITRRYSGSGLGLSICKRIVENVLKGKLIVKSTLGSGSCFEFSIPKCKIQTREDKLSEDNISKTVNQNTDVLVHRWEKDYFDERKERIKPIRVLIVDDNKMNRMVLKNMLKVYSKFSISAISSMEEAVNGKIAVEKYKEKPYDVIFMDIHMPEMDGLAATAIIREYEKEMKIQKPAVIAALTADAFLETKNSCLECGMNAFFSKPFKKEDIFLLLTERCFL